MAENPCIDAMTKAAKAAGIELTVDDMEAISTKTMRTLRRELGRLNEARTGAAGDVSADALVRMRDRVLATLTHDALLAKRRIALAVERNLANRATIDAHPDGSARGLLSLLIKDRSDHGRTLSVEDRARAIGRSAYAQLVENFERMAPRWLGLQDQPAAAAAMVRAMFNEDLSRFADLSPALRAELKAGADAWRAVTDGLRERFNIAGGDIGRLINWALPMSHSAERVRLRGAAEWVSDVLPLLDRSQYLNVDGSAMSTSQVKELLYAAHDTISTGGIVDAPRFGPGMIAKRHADPRTLFFKDADSWLRYHGRYSDRTVAGIMAGHIDSLARDIALVEVLGPNPHNAYKQMRATLEAGGATGRELTYVDNVFAHLTGEAARVEWQSLARFAQNVRSLQVAAKLGGAVLSSVTDFATTLVTSHFNNIPALRHVRNMITAFNPTSADDVRLAQRAGLGLDTLIGEINRWTDETLGGGWTGKTASAVIRASGLQAMTEANRRAFSVTMMSALGDLARKPWATLEAADVARLESYGFNAGDWALLSRVALEDWGGGNRTMLTPAAIGRLTDDALGATGAAATRMRNELVTKTLGMILSEESYAIVTPGVRERAFMLGGLKKGTAAGEIARSVWLFKSFPVAVIAKHWFRGRGRPTAGGRAAYLASFVVGTTLLGAVAQQLKEIAKGREPRDMTEPKFWIAALLQGGGAGIFGDFLFSDQSRFGRSVVETAVGPIGSLAGDVYDLTLGNVHQAARGQPTDAGAEAVRFVQANTPGMSLWYTRAALDHLIFHQVQEYMSPGYLGRMKRRVKEDTGQGFWWEPGR